MGALARWGREHPLLVVALVSGLSALAAALWIWRHRELGAYDPDEAGYLATALRYHRMGGLGAPVELVRQIEQTSHGPLVPLLAQPLLMIGPRDPRTAMMVQPLLLVLTAVSGAGIARRLAGPGMAIVVGCSIAALPTVVLASRSFWYGLAAAACASVAIWALLASDRLTNRWRWVYGLGVGLMPMARTMALGFVPAVLLAGLLIAWGDRRRMWRYAQTVVLGAAVAAPWWIARRSELWDYLTDYGFGERAGLWGSGGPLERTGFRLGRLIEGLHFLTPVAMCAVITALAVGARLIRRDERRKEAVPLDGITVGATCVAMFAALVTTTNQGVWFELPLVVLVAAAAVAALAVLPPRPRAAAAWGVVAALVVVGAMTHLDRTLHSRAALAEYDQRFDTTDRPTVAAAEWAALSERVEEELAQLAAGGRAEIYLTGNMFLFNSNTLDLTAELSGRSLRVRVPDTLGVDDHAANLTPRLEGELRPDGAPKERVLVVARHDLQLFTPDLEWPELDRQAQAHRWRETATFQMPVSGEVAILRHPSNLEAT